MNKPLRIIFAAGPGDVIGTYRHWKAGQDDPSQVSLTYSGQFFDFCREIGAMGYAISSCARRGLVIDGDFTVEHQPRPWPNARGIFYHLATIWSGLRLVIAAFRFRADVAVVAEGTTHWFVLSLLALRGVRVIPSLFCTLWPKFQEPRRPQRLINRLNGRFFRRRATAILSTSEDIDKQVRRIAGDGGPSIWHFLPTYRHDTFATISPPPAEPGPFRVLFAGRIERDKGVFDLLEVARRLRDRGQSGIVFDLCGSGSALEALRQAVTEAGIEEIFQVHGYCLRDRMQSMLSRSHALIVPTTIDFIEGFNQVVVEGILAGRPVITSAVCPAIEYVRDAVIEVEPGHLDGYAGAIVNLAGDPEMYREKQAACAFYQPQFYRSDMGWKAALGHALPAHSCHRAGIISPSTPRTIITS